MFNIFKTSKNVSLSINEFFDKIEFGILNFKKGVNNYLKGNISDFEENLKTNHTLEQEADSLKRKIENDFYVYSLMPNYSSDIINLLEKADDIIDMSKEVLSQFDVESPNIPEEIKKMYSKLAAASAKSVENMIPAARIFFTSPELVKEKTQKVLFYHREAHTLATDIKRKLFKECPNLKLSEKIHLRYFALHIEQISDAAKVVALLLASLVLKIKM
jgi:predicted phosphate transport protein (TIGR00153 family)